MLDKPRVNCFLADIQSNLAYSDNQSEIIDTLYHSVSFVKYESDIPYLIISFVETIKTIEATLHGSDGYMKECILKASFKEPIKAVKLRMSHDYVPGFLELLRVEVNGLTHYYTLQYNEYEK
jgi:hypothetical protein